MKLKALVEIRDEDFMTQFAKGYPNIPQDEEVEYIKEFNNLYGHYVRVKWNNTYYDTVWERLEVLHE